jgi:hypothetical protein
MGYPEFGQTSSGAIAKGHEWNELVAGLTITA